MNMNTEVRIVSYEKNETKDSIANPCISVKINVCMQKKGSFLLSALLGVRK